MKIIGLLKEGDYESRVCLLPSEVKRLVEDEKATVLFEPGCGQKIGISDDVYAEAGGIYTSQDIIYQNANVIASINHLYEGQKVMDSPVFMGIYNMLYFKTRLQDYKDINASIYSLDLLPRSTIAQSMDVLSSMASLAGYKAVIKASDMHGQGIPMFTTAAGTLKPAKVLVLGAGVAGLQAIATAKRLGAVVEAFDVRSSAGEEVRSLGAKFIEVEGYIESSSAGGYAVAQSEEYLKKQKALINKSIAEASIVISTANIPGKKAPVLIEKKAIDNMQSGSVIIDLAAEQGGNCELTINNKTIDYNGVSIVGDSHFSRHIPIAASQLLSKNYYTFMKHYFRVNKDEDELLKGARVVSKGELVHPLFTNSLEKA